jgi:exoribonuclease R
VSVDARSDLARALADVRRQLELPEGFPGAAEAEAAAAARDVPVDPDAAGLPDWRGIPFLTIDPAGSTDLDQAVHLERTAAGAVLHYAIADVPAFVPPGGAVDAEARRRGQTLYAPDGRIPLHPPVLSEDAASLLPEQDRRAFVWRFILDDGARPVETTLTRAVVRSQRQWSYDEAQAAIDAGTAPATLTALAWFGAERAARESERGGASLNIPEIEIVPHDGTYRLERRAAVPLEDWNAEVSLLTGMAAAEIMLRGGIGILRTMPPADAADVADFRERAGALGLPWPDGMPYGDYLRSLDQSPAAQAVREAAASLFRGAGYAAFDGEPPADRAQAAIAAPYAHTTAPLRRLVDRWSLVVCEALVNGRDVPRWARDSLADLPDLMARSAGRAGRLGSASVDRVEAAVLSAGTDRTFEAVVLARRGDGVRVQLVDPPVEASVAPLDAEPGTTVLLRLVRASIADGTVELVSAGYRLG